MVDETTDGDNKEQVAIVIDDPFNVHENFIGLYATTNAQALVAITKDTLLKLTWKIVGPLLQLSDKG